MGSNKQPIVACQIDRFSKLPSPLEKPAGAFDNDRNYTA